MFSIWLSVRGTKTSAGRAIWRQSFDKRQKNNAFWAHENNNISQRFSIERESKMRMRHVQKVYSDKIKSTASFNAGVFEKWTLCLVRSRSHFSYCKWQRILSIRSDPGRRNHSIYFLFSSSKLTSYHWL